VTTQALRTGIGSDAATVAVRAILFVAILLLCWVSVNPFPNLANPTIGDIGDSSDFINQIAYIVLAGAVGTYFLINEPWRMRPLVRPVYLAMFGWLVVSVVTSSDPGLSARRLVFSLLVILLAAALPLLPINLKRFSELAAVAVIMVLALCYAGVVLIPQRAIHQSYDVIEPLLAGNWRGTFSHKNIASAIMANFIFIGVFVAKARNAYLGWAIVVASALFLALSEGKASGALLPFVLLLGCAVQRTRSPVLAALLIFTPVIALNLFTVGSLYLDSIMELDKVVLKDPTFTGRNDIWQFALDNISERPWLGHGFGAFWETPFTVFQPSKDGSMATTASHAHNAFLDLTLTIGLVGAGIAIAWTLVLPFIDLRRCRRIGADPDLTRLFMRMWLFAIYTCSFESVLFDRGDPHWFTMLVAMFGLRYLSVARLTR
jgi:O-antigen ligase